MGRGSLRGEGRGGREEEEGRGGGTEGQREAEGGREGSKKEREGGRGGGEGGRLREGEIRSVHSERRVSASLHADERGSPCKTTLRR